VQDLLAELSNTAAEIKNAATSLNGIANDVAELETGGIFKPGAG